MTEHLEKLTAEVRKLTPAELEELRSWLAEYQPEDLSSSRDQDALVDWDAPVDWSDLFERVKAIRGNAPPLPENTVLALREEEEF